MCSLNRQSSWISAGRIDEPIASKCLCYGRSKTAWSENQTTGPNLNRCGGKTNEQFSEWAPGTEKEQQFHTPRNFGFVHFSAEKMPF